jgi:hypothetical protein
VIIGRALVRCAVGVRLVSSVEERREISGIGIAPLLGPFKRHLSRESIPALRNHDTQTARRRGVALRVRKPIGAFCAGKVPELLQQRAEVKCAIRLAALVRAAVARFRIAQVATVFQQDAQVEGRGRTAP